MKTLCLTLPERLDHVNSLKEKIPELEVFEAISPTSPEFAHIPFSNLMAQSWRRGLAAGEACCSWGHYKMLKEAALEPEPTLILEDDVKFLVEIPDLPPCYDILNLGTWGLNCSPDKRPGVCLIDNGLKPDGWAPQRSFGFGTQAYVVSPQGASSLCAHWLPIYEPVDVAMSRICLQQDLRLYGHAPTIASQNRSLGSATYGRSRRKKTDV